MLTIVCFSLDTECPEIKCNDGTCISGKLRCDGTKDCPNGDDEFSCGNLRFFSYFCLIVSFRNFQSS